jgi:hypothetical protein
MMKTQFHRRGRQRGVSLIEAAIALVIMAFGMLSIIGIQSSMRLNGDIARQRTEANRLAEEEMEKLRTFTVIPTTNGQVSWTDIATRAQAVEVSTAGMNTVYRIARTVNLPQADPPLKIITVMVSWQDRSGGPDQSITLESTIAAVEPGLSGLLGFAPTVTAASAGPGGRNPAIPPRSKDMGDGTSVFKPSANGTVAWVFNNLTGLITGVCTVATNQTETGTGANAINLDDIAACNNNTVGQLLSGTVRFNRSYSEGHPLTARDAEPDRANDPPLNFNVSLTLSSSGHPASPQCYDDAPTTRAASYTLQYANYYCIVYSNPAGTWSGISTIAPLAFPDWNSGDNWEIGTDEDQYRICRYTPAASDTVTPPTANVDHPRNYAYVKGSLSFQNFLVIRGRNGCPTDVPADPVHLDFVDTNTLQHQPYP